MNKRTKQIIRLICLMIALTMGNHANAQPCKQHNETCSSNSDCCQKQCEEGKCRRIWYNLPTYSMAKVAQTSEGWFIYMEFMWGEKGQTDFSCGPNFEKGKAVEFQVEITPKCFLQPPNGRDDRFNCALVMGRNDYALGPDPTRDNCYVDLWNYWNPSAFDVSGMLQNACGFDPSGNSCAWWGTALGAFLDPIGNFAVGLKDASVLEAGKLYSFRYPVEVNNSPDCTSTSTPRTPEGNLQGRICEGTGSIINRENGSLREDILRGYYTPNALAPSTATFHRDWARARVTMQTFNNRCDLGCDKVGTEYTCPHLIGVAAEGQEDKGCRDVDKYTDYWINQLCLPTGTPTPLYPKAGNYVFAPGEDIDNEDRYPDEEQCRKYDIEPCCMTEASSKDLSDYSICCVDQDGDGYYGPQSVELFGNKVGDCDDHNPDIYPGGGVCASDTPVTPEPPLSMPPEEEPESQSEVPVVTTTIPPATTSPSQPEPAPVVTPSPTTPPVVTPPEEPAVVIPVEEPDWIGTPEPTATDPGPLPERVCEPGDVMRQSTVCAPLGADEVLNHAVQEMPCTEQGQWRGEWSECVEDTPCSTPDEVQVARCTSTTIQERVCAYDGWWQRWSPCYSGQVPGDTEPEPGQNPEPNTEPGCECSSGDCCDGCEYLPSTATCEGWALYRCNNNVAEGKQLQRYCSGSSELCMGGGGTVEGDQEWQIAQVCGPNEICQVLGDGSYECADGESCTEVFIAGESSTCYNNPGTSGTPTLCLEVKQVSGSQWEWRVCKEGSTFTQEFSVTLIDENSGELFGPHEGSIGMECSVDGDDWHPMNLSYLDGFGIPDGAAGLNAEVKSPSSCNENTCRYRTGTITIRRECK